MSSIPKAALSCRFCMGTAFANLILHRLHQFAKDLRGQSWATQGYRIFQTSHSGAEQEAKIQRPCAICPCPYVKPVLAL